MEKYEIGWFLLCGAVSLLGIALTFWVMLGLGKFFWGL